ncbi:MAG: histidine phosphatase family protein [Actinomycetota bacterium]|nr:histidine phosphatase family protein [Actinomycetota bacterium]
MSTVVHLVRHGEVENPKGLIYGRLPGYHLSEVGQRQAEQSAEHLKDADLALVWTSPLERAQETAAAIAAPHALEVGMDERLLESETTLEGLTRNASHFLRSPLKWWHFRNPMAPSWGEPFKHIRARMVEVIKEATDQAEGREAVLVSHQTPVLVARLSLTRRRQPPWLGITPCQTGSITTLTIDDKGAVVTAYFSPPG